MQGGKCGPGALSAGLSAFASPLMGGRGFSVQKLVANAVIGGVASAAAGGNFANGAVTSAFGYLFNEFAHDRDRIRPLGTQEEIDQINDALGRLCVNSQTACRLFDDLRAGPGEVSIRITDRNTRYNYDSWTVYYNPNETVWYDGSEAWMRVPPEIGLAHELIHAFHDLRGTLAVGLWDIFRRTEETNTVGLTGNSPYTENMIRKDYGLPTRPRY